MVENINKKPKVFISIIILALLIIPLRNVSAQKDITIGVLPFLVDSDTDDINQDYGISLSRLITTKLFYSTNSNILTMNLIQSALANRKMDKNLENIQEPYLYLMAKTLNMDYILVPRLTIRNNEYRLIGALYNVENRVFVRDTEIRGRNIKRYIYNDIDIFTENIFSNILYFDETQPILYPSRINNLDIALYFDLDDCEFEYQELLNNIQTLFQSLNNIAIGDNIRVSLLFSKKLGGIKKYHYVDFLDEDSFYDFDKLKTKIYNRDEYFLNSPYTNIESIIQSIQWSTRKNNERYFIIFAKNGFDNYSLATVLNSKNINSIIIELENTPREIIESNRNLIKLTNGVNSPLSYNIVMKGNNFLNYNYIFIDNSIYRIMIDESYQIIRKQKKSAFVENIDNEKIELISYDLYIKNLEDAINFLNISNYGYSEYYENLPINTNIINTITNSISKMYKKNIDEFGDIILYNNGIIKKVSLPLYVANVIVNNLNEGDYFIMGARVLPTRFNDFELDPFSLIFSRFIYYLPDDLILKDFTDIQLDPNYYHNNGILNNNIWFFKVKLVKINRN